MFAGVLHGHALLDLADPNHVLKAFRQPEPAQHVLHDGGVADAGTLMMLHHPGGDVSVLRLCIIPYGFGLRKGLESKLAVEAMLAAAVPFKRFFPVPYRPEVGITTGGVVGMIPVAGRGMRTARPIGALWIQIG